MGRHGSAKSAPVCLEHQSEGPFRREGSPTVGLVLASPDCRSHPFYPRNRPLGPQADPTLGLHGTQDYAVAAEEFRPRPI